MDLPDLDLYHPWNLAVDQAVELALADAGADVALGLRVGRDAEDLAADMIVMGTKGRTGLKHLIMGSVAEKVVRRGRCPVLAIRDEACEVE